MHVVNALMTNHLGKTHDMEEDVSTLLYNE